MSEEVTWYKKHGKYPERITYSRSGVQYVIGDWSWNRQNPDKPEIIETIMRANIGARVDRRCSLGEIPNPAP